MKVIGPLQSSSTGSDGPGHLNHARITLLQDDDFENNRPRHAHLAYSSQYLFPPVPQSYDPEPPQWKQKPDEDSDIEGGGGCGHTTGLRLAVLVPI
ncbi:hypothetical protein N7474_003379 [Penicillium riverlandense]|uniref:uncharacterized protein n=1 Tax=Penicillium riverlandense TaxID=1903569 RepID=UPI0025491AD0|nr:uncharacterized protein N7474_003379 [Penicillium riverlandense]KAJ5826241.1 hypothetical protein N7474_003379 [Penicillium riverlandense]